MGDFRGKNKGEIPDTGANTPETGVNTGEQAPVDAGEGQQEPVDDDTLEWIIQQMLEAKFDHIEQNAAAIYVREQKATLPWNLPRTAGQTIAVGNVCGCASKTVAS